MKEKKFFYVEKMQIISVDTLPSWRWSIIPNSLGMSYTSWLPYQEYYMEIVIKKKFLIEKSDKHYLNQVNTVNIKSDKSCL